MISGTVARRVGNSALLIDLAPAVLVPLVLVVDAAVSSYGKPITVLSVLAGFVACLPLAFRRHIPFQVLIVLVVGGVVLALWQLHPADTVVVIPMIALFELAENGDRRRSLWLGVAVVPCVVVSVVPFAKDFSDLTSIVARNLFLCLLAIAGGELVRTKQLSALGRARAAEQETLRRVGEERLEIAREIHDVVAHAMTAINVQAGVAAHLLKRDPQQAHEALRNIKDQSGMALSELRSTLDVIRDPSQGVPLGPPAGFADVKQLTAGLNSAGVAVELDLDDTAELTAAVQSAGYRIVQEALTNVARHAGATKASVRLRCVDGTATIEVTDDGNGTQLAVANGNARAQLAAGGTAGAGNGLRGMRERVTALGGTLEAGPLEAGGWRVTARLPTTYGDANGAAGT